MKKSKPKKRLGLSERLLFSPDFEDEYSSGNNTQAVHTGWTADGYFFFELIHKRRQKN
jgi:hypothetical protein